MHTASLFRVRLVHKAAFTSSYAFISSHVILSLVNWIELDSSSVLFRWNFKRVAEPSM